MQIFCGLFVRINIIYTNLKTVRNMEVSVKQRLIEYIEKKGLSIREFEKMCGLSNGYMKSLRHAPKADKLSAILSAYPDLNRVWLLTGEGNMTNDDIIQNNKNGDNIQGHSVTVNKTEKEYLEIIRRQSEQISKSQDQIDRLLTIIEKIK